MNLIDLSFSAVLALACMATIGCQPQQTHIVRSTRLPDGTQYTYSNDSSGYGYNPNFTSNQNVDVAAPSAAANVNVNAGEGGGSWGFGSMGATPYGNSYGYPYGYGNAGAYYGGTTAITTVALGAMWSTTRSRNSQSIETEDPADTVKRMSIDLLNCFFIAT